MLPHPALILYHGQYTCPYAMRRSDRAALHAQLQQDAGGGAAVAEAEAGAEQKPMLSSVRFGEGSGWNRKGDSSNSAACWSAVLSTGKAPERRIARHLPQVCAAMWN